MKEERKKCIHDGHRMRLIETAFKTGVEDLSDIQVMELLLFYIFPRGDVNPLAHRLLTKFGSLTNVVDANAEELKSVGGISDASAKKLKVFAHLFFYYAHSRMRKNEILTVAEIVDVVEEYLRFHYTEKLLLIALSASSTIIRTRIIDLGQVDEVGMNMLDFSNFLSSTHPSSVVIAHCHPFGHAAPSEADEIAFDKVKQITQAFGVELLGSYIVGEDGVFSQTQKKLVRRYLDADELKETLLELSSQDVEKKMSIC